MIQRRQSLYLLVVVLLNAVVFNTIDINQFNMSHVLGDQSILIIRSLFSISALLALITIFLFKNRKLQFVLGRVNIILNFVLVGVFVYGLLNLPGEKQFSEKGIEMLLPIISIVFLVMANKAIKKDEDLVKSVDRFR
ncbi:DUF4293 domain-containing protein [Psychroflexus sp. ALD_RP9]|uniref:DUF4293 domain-containing protein n=1 Tax=Psychroflexus sp. ALD_RP9 TaxID=2777186 RepID=UPI001A8E3696|nr:DUF4293 domain-containing protein [Psychroflexus sp. ALD_RP9]QSS98349.1 DUF4293 domain-containing protein [Psychroflexus sp. ALD_RP9]